MESLYFLIPLFFIILIIIPLNIKTKICVNNKKNVYLSIFIFNIKLFVIKIFIKNNKLFLIKNNNKKEIELSLSIKQMYFIDYFAENILQKLLLYKLQIYFRFGKADAYKTAITCGYVNAISKVLFGILKTYKKNCEYSNITYPAYNQNTFCFALVCKFSISIFDILYSIIISMFSLRGINGKSKQELS